MEILNLKRTETLVELIKKETVLKTARKNDEYGYAVMSAITA